MTTLGDRRITRRDRRSTANTPSPNTTHAAARDFRPSRTAETAVPDLISVENERLHGELRDHIIKLQEVNRQLVISGVNAQVLAEQLRAAKAEMTHLAHHDHLTTLPNRIQFKQQLAATVGDLKQRGGKLALLFIDLDRFKVINDTLGHTIGDLLLQAVAQRLAACVRGSDAVSRHGGDEFVAMLADVKHLKDVSARVAHIHHQVTAPYIIANHVLHIGASIGVSIYPDDVADPDSLVRNADIAMYAVKQHGRNSFAFFEQRMVVRAAAHNQMEVGLRKALAKEEFVLYYQAQVDLATRRITGAEALIRWQHPSEGLLQPKSFIGFADECGIIKLIDRWVLREACLQVQHWLDAGFWLDSISVNISAQEFECGDFVQMVFTTLSDTGLAPEHLELELTEGTMVRDSASTVDKLNELRAAGIRIAIDDFGTGYSSLSYLRRLPIDTLKIDQTFVADIHPGTAEILIDTIISIGNRLHHNVIAEGIETVEQLRFLQDHACGSGQGFYLSKPMVASDFVLTLACAAPDKIA